MPKPIEGLLTRWFLSLSVRVWLVTLAGCTSNPSVESPNDVRSSAVPGAPEEVGPPEVTPDGEGPSALREQDKSAPALTSQEKSRLDAYYWVNEARLLDADPDSRELLVGIRGQVDAQAFLVDGPLAQRRQVTFGTGEVVNAELRGPLVVAERRGSNGSVVKETWDRATGALVRSGDTAPAAPVADRVWSPNGQHFVGVAALVEGGPGLVIGSRGSEAVRRLAMPKPGSPLAWLPSGEEVVVASPAGGGAHSLTKLNVITEEWSTLFPSGEEEAACTVVGALEGDTWYLLPGGVGRARKLSQFTPSTGRFTDLFSDGDRFIAAAARRGASVALVTSGPGGEQLVVLRNRDAKPEVLALPRGTAARDVRFFDEGKQVALTLRSFAAPSDVYVFDLKTRKLARWTSSESAGIGARLVAPERVSWEGAGGVAVSAAYYRPQGSGPFPVLLWFEGAVGDAHEPAYRPLLQYFVAERGIAILAPEVRGTRGKGAAYEALDDGAGRFASVADAAQALNFVQTRSELDATRVAVLGSGYGGWQALSLLLEFGNRLVAAAVPSTSHGDLTAFVTQAKGAERASRLREFGDPAVAEAASYLLELSPSLHLSLVRRPLLVGEGVTDVATLPEHVHVLRAACVIDVDDSCEAGYRSASQQIAAYLTQFLTPPSRQVQVQAAVSQP